MVSDPVNITVTAVYDYDGAPAPLSYVNTKRDAVHYTSSTTFFESYDGEVQYDYTGENVSDTNYGITAFSSNTATVSWGGLFIESYNLLVDDTRLNLEAPAYLRYNLRFSGNQSEVGTGTLWVNGYSHTIDSGWANFTVTQSETGLKNYNVTAVDVSGETDYGQIPLDPEVIWDRVIVTSFSADAVSVPIDVAVELRALAELEYDGHDLGTDDVLFIESLPFTWDPSDNRWEYLLSYATPGVRLFDSLTGVSEDTYNITVGTMNGIAFTIEWYEGGIGGGSGSGGGGAAQIEEPPTPIDPTPLIVTPPLPPASFWRDNGAKLIIGGVVFMFILSATRPPSATRRRRDAFSGIYKDIEKIPKDLLKELKKNPWEGS